MFKKPQKEPEKMLPPDLGLDGFELASDDQGLSLDELSRAYAELLGQGEVPFDQPAEEIMEEEAPAAATHAQPAEKPASVLLAETKTEAEVDACCDLTPRTILEAMLFVGTPGNDPISGEQVAALMRGVRPAEIDDLVRELNETYDYDGAPYRIASIGAGYRLQLRPEYEPLRDNFFGRVREAKLSQLAIDVLSIVAYSQPIGKEAIDKVRGKPSSALLAQLVRRNLLRLERKPEQPDAPVYLTTPRFLQFFGLAGLEDLPRSQDLDQK